MREFPVLWQQACGLFFVYVIAMALLQRHARRRGRALVVASLGLIATAAVSPVGPAQDSKSSKPAPQAQAAPATSAAAARVSATVAHLGFLTGVWQGSDGASQWESWYSSPEGGQIVGASKELHDGHVVTIDFEHFYEREGTLRMTPFPFGKKSVEFTLATLDAAAKRVVFENPAHDVPSRFTYQRVDDQRLRIVLEGQPGVPPGTLTLEFTRREQ